MFQNIQRKRAICKLITATFAVNSVGLPTFLAEDVAAASSGRSLVVGDHSKDKTPDTSKSNTDIKDEKGLPTIKGNNEDRNYPRWYFHSDGTPLSTAELKARNYKESYTTNEIAQIHELLNTYGLKKVQQMQFNVSFRQNADGTTTIDANDKVNHNPTKGAEPGKDKNGNQGKLPTTPKEKQLNPTTDGSGTAPSTPETKPTCDTNSELVGGVCMVKCEAGSKRDEKDKLCHVTSCPTGTIYNTNKTACTVCPTGEEPNAAQTACVKKTATCGDNEIYADNDKTSCKVCPTGEKPNAAKTECEKVVCATNEIYKNDAKTVCEACPDGQMPNADQTACVAKPSETPAKDDTICDTSKGEFKGSDGKCQTCPTGQTLNAAGTACVKAATDTCDTSSGKEIWKDSSGKENCVDTCLSGQTRDESTGACVTKKTDTPTDTPTEPTTPETPAKPAPAKRAPARVTPQSNEVTPAAETPAETSAAQETPAEQPKSSGGSHKGNSIGKYLAGAAGIAALASLFGHKKCTGDQCDGGQPNKNDTNSKRTITRASVVDEKTTSIKFFNKDGSPAEKIAPGESPYQAIVTLGTLKDSSLGKPYSATISIKGTDIQDVKFESGQKFELIKDGKGLEAKPYEGLIKVSFIKENGDAVVDTLKFNLNVNESFGRLGEDSDEFGIAGVKEMKASDLEEFGAKSVVDAEVITAQWVGDEESGYCELRIKGGTYVDEVSHQEGPQSETTVVSQNFAPAQCTDKELSGKKAAFSNLVEDTSINSMGIARDEGEVTVGDNGYYRTEQSYQAMIKRLQKQFGDHDLEFLYINQTGGSRETSTPIVYDRTTNTFKDYAGNNLNEEQKKLAVAGLYVSTLDDIVPEWGDDKTFIGFRNKETGSLIELDSSEAQKFDKNLAELAPKNANVPGQQNGLSNYLRGLVKTTHPITGAALTPTQIYGVNTEVDPGTYSYEQTGGDTSSKSYYSDIRPVILATGEKAINVVVGASANSGVPATKDIQNQQGSQAPAENAEANAETTSGTTNNDNDSSNAKGKVN